MTTRQRRKAIRFSRDGILFFVGLAGIIYETLVVGSDRPTLIVLFGAMVGLPAFLRTDEKAHDVAVEKTAPTKETDKTDDS